MWSSIISTLLELVKGWFGRKERKEILIEEEKKEKQSAENIKKAELARDVEIRDESEILLKKVREAQTPEERKAWLDEVRRRVSH